MGVMSGPAWGATLSVDSSSGTAYQTISAAIRAASSGDTIEVAAGTYTEAIDYGGKDLEIVGASGPASTILDAGGSSAFAIVLSSGESKNATLEGFTVRNAGQQGAYVYSSGISFTDVIFEDLGAEGDSGGAIQATWGTVEIDGCTFSGGVASTGAHIYASGGKITSSSSTYDGATATVGGSWYLTDDAVGQLSSDTVSGNVATTNGGGLVVGSGASVEIDASTLSGNYAAGSYGYGGALFVDNDSSATVSGSTFEDNGYEEYDSAYTYGGAVTVYNYATATISNTTFSNNLAYYGGAVSAHTGSDLTLDNVTASDNYGYTGGVLYTYYLDELVLQDSTFSDNVSYSNFAVGYLLYTTNLLIDGSDFADNTATYGYGGAFGIYYTTTFDIGDSTFVDNFAYYYGGAVYAYYVYGASTVSDTLFEGNTARYGHGGGMYVYYSPDGMSYTDVSFLDNSSYYSGGGLYQYYGPATLDGVLLDGNEAETRAGGGALVHSPSASWGYGLILRDVTATDNVAGSDGGGLVVTGGKGLTLEDLVVTGNSADNAGGGIYATGNGEVGVHRLVVADNDAYYGGGLYVRGGVGELDSSQWTNMVVQANRAVIGGGACFLENEATGLWNNTFVQNSATDVGASLCLFDEALDARNNIFAHDHGTEGLYAYDATTVGLTTFEYNNFYDHGVGMVGGSLSEPDVEGEGTLEVDPTFANFDSDGDWEEDSLVLDLASPLVDAGDPMTTDPDGSASDIGAFGGIDAPTEDADEDGWLRWQDCDDSDATINPDATEVWYDGVNSDCSGASDFDQDGDGEDSEDYGGPDCDDFDADITAEDCVGDDGGDDTGSADGGDDGGDDGGTDDGGDDGGTDDGGVDDGGDDTGTGEGAADGGGETGSDAGCSGCSSAPATGGAAWLLLALGTLIGRRRD